MIKYGSRKFILSRERMFLQLEKRFDKQERRGFYFKAERNHKNLRRLCRLCERGFRRGRNSLRCSLRVWGDTYEELCDRKEEEVTSFVRNALARVVWK